MEMILQAASNEKTRWKIFEEKGVVYVIFAVAGSKEALDPATFFRKMYWPCSEAITAPLDAGLPYLTALLSRQAAGGNSPGVAASGVWRCG